MNIKKTIKLLLFSFGLIQTTHSALPPSETRNNDQWFLSTIVAIKTTALLVKSYYLVKLCQEKTQDARIAELKRALRINLEITRYRIIHANLLEQEVNYRHRELPASSKAQDETIQQLIHAAIQPQSKHEIQPVAPDDVCPVCRNDVTTLTNQGTTTVRMRCCGKIICKNDYERWVKINIACLHCRQVSTATLVTMKRDQSS